MVVGAFVEVDDDDDDDEDDDTKEEDLFLFESPLEFFDPPIKDCLPPEVRLIFPPPPEGIGRFSFCLFPLLQPLPAADNFEEVVQPFKLSLLLLLLLLLL